MPNLVRFGFALGVLNIHPWVSCPRRLVYAMAGARSSCLSEEVVADFAQVGKADPLRIASHLCKDVGNI